MPLPTQLSPRPGPLRTWGQEDQEAASGSPSHSRRFWKKFLYIGKCVKPFQPLVQICSFYPHSYPPPPNRLWGFFLKRGEGTPGSSEHRTVKSLNLTWVFPLRAERPTPSFYKTIERLRRLCQKSICFKKEKSARELSSPVPSGEFASEFGNGANLSLGSAGQQPPGGHRPSPQGAPLPSRPLFLPSTPIRYLLQVGCLGAEKGLLARHSWGRIPGRGVSLQRFSGESQRREASRGSLGSNVLFTIKIYFTIYLFFFL